jgi:hypothetical protein
LQPEQTVAAIGRSVEIKGEIVSKDEHETSGLRSLLNYGHTIGHALEAVTGYQTLLHGEAVAIGMAAAAQISARLGLLDQAEVARHNELLARFGLSTRCPVLPMESLWSAMSLDKKVQGGALRWVLLEGLGRATLRAGVQVDLVDGVIAELWGHIEPSPTFALLAEDPTGARLGAWQRRTVTCSLPLHASGHPGLGEGATSDDLAQLDTTILLANAYHLFLRPGAQVVKSLGGLHRFMRWSGPILTDSGGYQVFSLSPFRRVSEDGVEFTSHWDGQRHFFTPESALAHQSILGADIAMVLDEPPRMALRSRRCASPPSGRIAGPSGL